MTQQVYGHRIRTITDSMIVRGLQLALESDDEPRALYAYDGSDDFLNRYLDMDDHHLWAAVLAHADERVRSIFGRLRGRQLFRELALMPIDERRVPNSVIRTRLTSLTPEKARDLESVIAG